MPRHCLTLDLKSDPAKIIEYKRYHETIWPEIRESLYAAGVTGIAHIVRSLDARGSASIARSSVASSAARSLSRCATSP